MAYNKVLQQRNSLASGMNWLTKIMQLLDIYDDQLNEYARPIYTAGNYILLN
ncbi:MAG: hypothetical protein IPJ31_08780 [Bacteroidetes bacterium]|nr:hypothetical protein [Bacteroidota bacterium]